MTPDQRDLAIAKIRAARAKVRECAKILDEYKEAARAAKDAHAQAEQELRDAEDELEQPALFDRHDDTLVINTPVVGEDAGEGCVKMRRGRK